MLNRSWLLMATAFAILVGTMVLGPPEVGVAAGQQRGSAPVTVVNGADQPVPVTGAVTATLSNPLTATVSNSSLTPLFVRDVGPSQPFQRSFQFVEDTLACVAVPANKRMVIELVTLNFRGHDSETFIGMSLRTTVAAQAVAHALSLQRYPNTNIGNDESFLVATHVLRAYADPGTSACIVRTTLVNGPVDPGEVTLAGHLLDIAMPQ